MQCKNVGNVTCKNVGMNARKNVGTNARKNVYIPHQYHGCMSQDS